MLKKPLTSKKSTLFLLPAVVIGTYQWLLPKLLPRTSKTLLQLNQQRQLTKWAQEPVQYSQPDCLFLGDSITQGFNLTTHFGNLNYHFVNRGINGDTIKDLVARLSFSFEQLQPKKIVLLVGCNDLANTDLTPSQLINQYRHLLALIKEQSPLSTLYIQSIYPVNKIIPRNFVEKELLEHRHNQVIQEMNNYLIALADELEVTYIDVYNSLLDHNGSLKASYTKEGLHLTEIGYRAVASVLRSYLN